MSRYIAAYDISHGGRRARVAKVLRRFGQRVQRSLFEVWLEGSDHADLRRAVGPLLARTDEFELFPLDTRPERRRTRWQESPDRWEAVRMA